MDLVMPNIFEELTKELELPSPEPPPTCEFVVVAAMALLNRKNSK